MSKEKRYTVKTPNPYFKGVREGVYFKEGEAKTTKEQAEKLVKFWGYKCDGLSDKKVSAKKDKTPPPATGSQAIDHWSAAVAAVKDFQMAEEIDAFVKGDERESVIKAAAERKEELAKRAKE